MRRSNNGFTLIELLMTLTISSVTIVLVWGVLLNGINNSNKVLTQSTLQQEANYIITQFTSIHQNKGYHNYTISTDSPKDKMASKITITLLNKDKTVYKTVTISDQRFLYTLHVDPKKVKFEEGNYLKISLTVIDANNTSNIFTTKTIISRL